MWTEPYMKSANAPKLSVNVVNTTGSMQEQSKYRKYWWYWFPLLWKLKLIYYSKGFVVWAGAPHHSSSNFITSLTYAVLPLFFFAYNRAFTLFLFRKTLSKQGQLISHKKNYLANCLLNFFFISSSFQTYMPSNMSNDMKTSFGLISFRSRSIYSPIFTNPPFQ